MQEYGQNVYAPETSDTCFSGVEAIMKRPVSAMSKMTLKTNSDLHNKIMLLRGVEASLMQRMDPNSDQKGLKLIDQLKMLGEKVKAT